MALHLKEQGIEFSSVFLNTGWEADETYEYIRGPLQDAIGPIQFLTPAIKIREEDQDLIAELEELLGFESAFIRLCVRNGYFPRKMNRNCTTKLKLETMRRHLRSVEDEPINCVGIRREEGGKRASAEELSLIHI